MQPEPDLSRDFSHIFSHVVAGVVIVAAADAGGLDGCTASVWAEVAEPPLVLVTLAHSSATLARLRSAGRFSVNLLGEGQDKLAYRFGDPATSGPGRFGAGQETGQETGHEAGQETGQETGRWERSGEAPVLLDARAFYRCRLVSTHPFGAHEIVVGEVTGFAAPRPHLAPLVFVHDQMAIVELPGRAGGGSS